MTTFVADNRKLTNDDEIAEELDNLFSSTLLLRIQQICLLLMLHLRLA